jgi:hypothetical protein
MSVRRFDNFTPKELALISLGLTTAVVGQLADPTLDKADRARFALDVIDLMDEIGQTLDQGGIDPELRAMIEKAAEEG